jgi:hypothetical protein
MPANNPVLLFPMRVEIYYHQQRRSIIIRPPKNSHLKPKRKMIIQPEFRLRWYPDECQVYPPLRGSSEDELKAYERYQEKTLEIQNDQSLSGEKRERALQLVFSELAEITGKDRALFLKYAGPEKGGNNPFERFMQEGASLKILPERVRLYTIHEKNGSREVKFLAEGEPIPNDLRISINDKISPWTTDFNEAIRKGMGLKITGIAQCNRLKVAKWLVAVGCKADSEENQLLAELLLRHKLTGDLDILAQNTVTNNTEQEKTNYLAAGPAGAEVDPPRKGFSFTSGDILSQCLGVDPEIWNASEQGPLKEQQVALRMNRLLWYVCTHDYCHCYMNYLTPQGLFRMKDNLALWENLTEHFMKYVIGRGLLPSIRLGENPYGILPVTRLDTLAAPAQKGLSDQPISAVIARICQIFRDKFIRLAENADGANSFGIPVIDDAKDEEKMATLVQILQRTPVAHRLDVQAVFKDLQSSTYDLDSDPERLTSPLVSETEEVDYLKDLVEYFRYFAQQQTIMITPDKNGAQFRLETQNAQSGLPLLRRLLQYALLCMEDDCHDLNHQADEYLKKNDQALYDATLQERDRLLDKAARMAEDIQFFSKFTAMELEQLLLEVMDCLSHRLDAWITSLAHEKLVEIDPVKARMGRKLSAGNFIGVYGWLEKPYLKEDTSRSAGYFQTPSLNQATTGALLLNAALTNHEKTNGAFQVNLSSKRVKQALWFVEGLQKGFTPAELLGYRVERKVHEYHLDQYLIDLRECYSLQGQNGQEEVPSSGGVVNGEKFLADEGNQDLSAYFRKKALPAPSDPGLLSKINALRHELQRLKDAVSDLYIAEVVHHMAQGNTSRVAAWLEVMEGKITPPEPEVVKTPRNGQAQLQKIIYPLPGEDSPDCNTDPRVLADPAVANYCAVQLTPYIEADFQVTVTARNQDEVVYCVPLALDDIRMNPIDLVVGGKAELEQRTKVMLCEFMAGEIGRFKFLGEDFGQNPSPAKLEDQAYITFDYDYAVNGAPLFKKMFETVDNLRLFLRSVRPLTHEDYSIGKRGSGDLAALLSLKIKGFKILKSRVNDLAACFNQAKQDLTVLCGQDHPDQMSLREVFQCLSRFNILEAVEVPCKERAQELLASLSKQESRFQEFPEGLQLKDIPLTVNIDGQDHLVCFNSQTNAWEEVTDPGIQAAAMNALVSQAISAIKAMTQETMTVIPPFYPDKTMVIGDGVQVAYEEYYRTSLAGPMFKEYRLVRNNINMLLKLMENNKDGSGKWVKVYSDTGLQKSWEEAVTYALKDLAGPERLKVQSLLQNGALVKPVSWRQSNIDFHYILYEGGLTLTPDQPVTAVVVDEWTDFIANTNETTALAFQYEVPKAEAPQVLLMAVPPETWGPDIYDDLKEILADTIDLLRIRSVPAEMVVGSNLGYFLPALLFGEKGCEFPKEPLDLVDGVADNGFVYEVK